MIVVKLEDFEKYRKKLTHYAEGLLFSRGSNRTLFPEVRETAKDIVQQCYLRFHNHYKDAFVTEDHLINFLKLCLYRCYQESKDYKRRSVQYNLLKDGEIDWGEPPENLAYEIHTSRDFDLFMESLNKNQQNIVTKLLLGFSGEDIAKEEGVSRQCINLRLNKIRDKYKEYYEI